MQWLTSGNARGRDSFTSILNKVEAELSATKGGFFLGDEVAVVDMMFTPFLERMVASMLYFKGAPNACSSWGEDGLSCFE